MKHTADIPMHAPGKNNTGYILAAQGTPKRPAGFQAGLSLIELMISITIGLIILVSLSTLFINQSKSRAELDKSNRMIDNGRYALELLSGNLRLAGFYDNYAPVAESGVPVSLYDPCNTAALTNTTQNRDILLVPVQGYNSAAPTPTSQIASLPCGSAGLTYTGSHPTVKPGSDILVVRRVNTVSIAQNTAVNDGTFYFQSSGCEFDDANTPFKINTNPANLHLGQKNILLPAPANNCIQVASVITIAPPYANLRPFLVEVYYVSPDNKSGDGIPTLKKLELTSGGFAASPLVEGIEYMQIDYGIDDNGDGAADRYIDCAACSSLDWTNVVAVKINIVARNTETTRGYSDPKTYSLGLAGIYTPSGSDLNYKRHAYTQLVRLVNPSGRKAAE